MDDQLFSIAVKGDRLDDDPLPPVGHLDVQCLRPERPPRAREPRSRAAPVADSNPSSAVPASTAQHGRPTASRSRRPVSSSAASCHATTRACPRMRRAWSRTGREGARHEYRTAAPSRHRPASRHTLRESTELALLNNLAHARQPPRSETRRICIDTGGDESVPTLHKTIKVEARGATGPLSVPALRSSPHSNPHARRCCPVQLRATIGP
jgi:hypothetical protein